MSDVIRIKGSVSWNVAGPLESGHFVGICDALGLSLQTNTWKDMMEEIGDVQVALFQDLLQTGELHSFLADRGLTIINKDDDINENALFDLRYFPQQVDTPATDFAQAAH